MTILHFLIVLVLVGVALWLVNTYVAKRMAPPIVTILNVAVVIIVILWVISVIFPNFGSLSTIRVGK